MDCQLRRDWRGATRSYERALDLDPSNTAAIVNLAMVQAHEAGDLALAIAILTNALVEIRMGTVTP